MSAPAAEPAGGGAAADGTALTVDGREDLFGREGQAVRYAKYRPRYTAEMHEDAVHLLGHAGQGRWPLALDVACGTGQLTAPLARWFDRVIGVDQSPEQLAHAARPEASNGWGTVSYVAGSAYELSALTAPCSVDLVVVGQALHWFDFERFFPSVAEVLRPGGGLAVLGYALPELDDPRCQEVFKRFYLNILGGGLKPGQTGCWWDCDRSLVDTAFEVLAQDGFGPHFEPPGAADGGFLRRWCRQSSRQAAGSFFEYLRTMSAYRSLMARSGVEDPLQALQRDMGIEDLTQDIGVTFPFFILTAKKR